MADPRVNPAFVVLHGEPPDLPAAGDPFVVGGFVIEGVTELDEETRHHVVAFYEQVIDRMNKAGPSWQLIRKEKYDKILAMLIRQRNGEELKELRAEYPQCYKWCLAFAIVKDGVGGFILVARPQSWVGSHGVDENADLDTVKRISYFESAFFEIRKAHGTDHCKGNTIFARVSENIANIGRNITKCFTSTCPICIKREKRTKPVPGLKPILSRGFGTRGQVDLIDFQSMPNGDFKFLMNYIDHGIKFLFSIPLKRKRASCVAVALLEIFTVIGPPMILQSDNGKEFSSAAMTATQRSEENRGRCEGLSDDLLIEVIDEVKKLWPDCRMVRGSARHSESNGGVERVNRTMEEKLGAWMRETGNINWSIGCRLMMWRYNTQTHRTVDDVPYNLLFGHMPRVGISNLPLANGLIDTLATEAQLNKVCDYVGKVVVADDELPAVIGDEVLQGGQGDQDQAAEAAFNAEIEYAEMITSPTNADDGVLVGEIGNPDDNEDGDEIQKSQ